jgi:hypothetical protein
VGLAAAGCEPPVPTNPQSKGKGNPYVSGNPEERIKRIEADTTLTPEEKAQRIAVIKQRNNLN